MFGPFSAMVRMCGLCGQTHSTAIEGNYMYPAAHSAMVRVCECADEQHEQPAHMTTIVQHFILEALSAMVRVVR